MFALLVVNGGPRYCVVDRSVLFVSQIFCCHTLHRSWSTKKKKCNVFKQLKRHSWTKWTYGLFQAIHSITKNGLTVPAGNVTFCVTHLQAMPGTGRNNRTHTHTCKQTHTGKQTDTQRNHQTKLLLAAALTLSQRSLSGSLFLIRTVDVQPCQYQVLQLSSPNNSPEIPSCVRRFGTNGKLDWKSV